MPSPGLNVVVLLEKKNHRDFGSEVNFLILQLKPRIIVRAKKCSASRKMVWMKKIFSGLIKFLWKFSQPTDIGLTAGYRILTFFRYEGLDASVKERGII